MKILLTGSTGYIGKRLLPVLVEQGHHVVCAVRDRKRFSPPGPLKEHITVIEMDLLDGASLGVIPKDVEGAFYLVHSMSHSSDYQQLEERCAINFKEAMNRIGVNHVMYLGGIVNDTSLSEHLASRKNVGQILASGQYNFTALRAGIIIGSGSASFEIIRDLVEKLPVMIAPKWLRTKCQPIGITDVISFLSKGIFNERLFNKTFDIGGTDVLSYKEMLLGFAAARNLKRRIWTVPVMTPKLSSYWLYFVTSTSYRLAQSLVDSMKIEVVCAPSDINQILEISPLSYREALDKAFTKIENNAIISSWKDAYASSGINGAISDFVEVPTYGCFKDQRSEAYDERQACIQRMWSIGGETGWYYGNWLWQIRGYLDKLVGGVGLRRGRTHKDSLDVGDALDFWRVLYADKEEGRLLLLAEMKLPGEAWLEFRIKEDRLYQTATFRPLGLAGRLYWYAVFPFHGFIFQGMLRKLSGR